MIGNLWKPWFVYQPRRLISRIISKFLRPSPGYAPIKTSWGALIKADPTRAIGHSILTTGIYDLAVSEALVRLIDAGDTIVDAGANVGYMTLLASVCAGSSGRVLSFEPHPELFSVLQDNASAIKRHSNAACIELYQSALGGQDGTANLCVPSAFSANDGIAHLELSSQAERGKLLTVQVRALDGVLKDAMVNVLKLDVEGYELQVLQGSIRAIAEHRISHIVFEDHKITDSAVASHLLAAGYRIFALGWSMRGIKVQPAELGRLATDYEAPSFIATIAPDEAVERCRQKGWRVFSGNLLQKEP